MRPRTLAREGQDCRWTSSWLIRCQSSGPAPGLSADSVRQKNLADVLPQPQALVEWSSRLADEACDGKLVPGKVYNFGQLAIGHGTNQKLLWADGFFPDPSSATSNRRIDRPNYRISIRLSRCASDFSGGPVGSSGGGGGAGGGGGGEGSGGSAISGTASSVASSGRGSRGTAPVPERFSLRGGGSGGAVAEVQVQAALSERVEAELSGALPSRQEVQAEDIPLSKVAL